jgi:biopolymer transport protein ExbD
MRNIRPGFLIGVLLPIIFFGAVAPGASQTPSVNTPPAASHNSQPEAQVLVTIVSKGGGPLPAPAKSDFLVQDDQHSVEVNELRSVKDDPLIFSLLVDASGSVQSTRLSQIAGAITLFKALSKQGNRGYLILFRDEVATNDKLVDARTAEQILNYEDSRRGATALYDAVVHAASKQLTLAKNYPSSRRAIFLFSDGGDNSSRNSLERTLTILQREGIPVFSISTPSKKPDKRDLAKLHALSQNTGGDIVSLDESGGFVSRVLEYIDNQYLLSFSAFPGKREKLHSLEVKSISNVIAISAPTHYLGR